MAAVIVRNEAAMSIFSDDDRPAPKPLRQIGQDLSTLSLSEIDQRISAERRNRQLKEMRSRRTPRAQPPTPSSASWVDPKRGETFRQPNEGVNRCLTIPEFMDRIVQFVWMSVAPAHSV